MNGHDFGWIWRKASLTSSLLLLLLCSLECSAVSLTSPEFDRLNGRRERETLRSNRREVVQLEMERRVQRGLNEEAGTRDIGLGDSQDVSYNVLLTIGSTTTPLIIDTGSADLWVLSENCDPCSRDESVPLYDPSDFEGVADVTLTYGDSRTGTRASGTIGYDSVGIMGMTLPDQYFAAVNETNTSVLDMGSAGIFGLGFPVNSILWNDLYDLSMKRNGELSSRLRSRASDSRFSHSGNLPSSPIDSSGDFSIKATTENESEPSDSGALSTFSSDGPFATRLFLDDDSPLASSSPQFTVTLQRTTPSLSGDVGTLTLGGLPSGIDDFAVSWSDVRLYTPDQGGLIVSEAPGEHYPYAWEVPLESVYFNGVELPMSSLGDINLSGVGTSALIDTGNSLIRGPADTVIAILALLSNTTSSPSPFDSSGSEYDESLSPDASEYARYTEEDYEEWTERFDAYAYAYPCGEDHQLSFQFGGKKFDVDPRDFGRPVNDKDAKWCIPNIAPTDPPKLGGYLYSWSLGEPFIRGTLTSFYFGNFTHPSVDPPRIGFLSTIPDNEAVRLAADVRAAKSLGAYPETSIPAPSGTSVPFPVTTNADGVIQISESSLPSDLAMAPTSVAYGSVAGDESGSNEQRSGADAVGLRTDSGQTLGLMLTVFWTIAFMLVGVLLV